MDECDYSVSFSSDSMASGSDETDTSSSSKLSWNNLSEAHDGPLYQMKSLMSSLPLRRGLSKFYDGKSQSFSCLTDVKCVEELAKDSHYRRKKMKTCHSCDSRLNNSYDPRVSSASMISKRSHKGSKALLSKKVVSYVMSSRPPVSPTKHI